MSYMKPDADGRQYIYMDVKGRVIQSLPSEPGYPKVVYTPGEPQSVNEAMAVMSAMGDFLESNGVKVSLGRNWKFKRALRFNGRTWFDICNLLHIARYGK